MLPFFRYFLKFTLHSKTKQPLLFIAVFGLMISSFALLFLQGAMGGMQKKQVDRSKAVTGTAVISFSPRSYDSVREITNFLTKEKISWRRELVLELLIKNGDSFSPLIVHGIEKKSEIVGIDRTIGDGIVLGFDVAIKIGASVGDQVRLINPGKVDSFMATIPKMATLFIDDVVSSQVPDVDSIVAWAPLIRVQGLIDERSINTVRIFTPLDSRNKEKLEKLLIDKGTDDFKLIMWNKVNATLVKALSLETTMMVFLFSCMSLLVALSITSGLMLFFDKIKRDLVSLWILGKDESELSKLMANFLLVLILSSIFAGLVLSTTSLVLLDNYGPSIMPEIFVDQKIPVSFNIKMYLVSFLVPFLISAIFSFFALNTFKKEVNYLDYVRAL